MTTDTEALRAKYERQCRGLDLSRNEDGVYTDEFVYVAWIHYREGYATAKAETAAAVAAERERCLRIVESVDNYSNPMTANDCADAIRAGAKSDG